MVSTVAVTDRLGRPLRDLRISVTDRCNFRCVYCMPREIFGRDYTFLPHDELLTFEEIVRLVRVGVTRGVEKVRLTGGEPLLRKGIAELIRMLATLKTADGRDLDIALTTNGSALAHLAPELKAAGLDRVTVSIDSLDDERFRAMNDVGFPVGKVLEGIRVAHEVGLGPIKINAVVKRGANDADVVDLARYFKGSPFILRFIEYMDVGSTNGWRLDEVVPSAEIVERINAVMPIEPVEANYPGETSARWRYRDGTGEIGVISSVTQSFCQSCTRARVSAEGRMFNCLFASEGQDLRTLMREGCSDEALASALSGSWGAREDRYSDLRGVNTPELANPRGKRIEMSYIGG
ncbi:MAG TPA: GTP 3',8-cyclase MoaA [Galbitalea sp.]|jgi:cyclic pyranopterin phosphate synthase|nr:GTP 3',8-cyclase MoaA [Galbitalea sp.]